MRRIATASILAISVIAVGTAHGADRGFDLGSDRGADDSSYDLRLALGTAPGVTENEFSGGSTDVDANQGLLLEVGPYWRFDEMIDGDQWGAVLGTSLFWRGSTGDNDVPGGGETSISAFGIKLAPGPAYRMDQLRFEATPFLSLGLAAMEVDTGGPGGDIESEWGSFISYGVEVGGFYDFNRDWFGGVKLGYEWFGADVTFEDVGGTGTDVDNEASGSGFILALVVGWRM